MLFTCGYGLLKNACYNEKLLIGALGAYSIEDASFAAAIMFFMCRGCLPHQRGFH